MLLSVLSHEGSIGEVDTDEFLQGNNEHDMFCNLGYMIDDKEMRAESIMSIKIRIQSP